MVSQPALKSRKPLILIWFRFLQLCHRDPDLHENLRQSEDYYREWGDVTDVSFDEWWKHHKGLFGGYVREVGKVSSHSSELTISIPLNQPVSKSLREVKTMIEGRQRDRLLEIGQDPSKVKSLNVGFSNYEFTSGTEIRGKVLYEILLIYTIWVDNGKPPVNTDFIMKVLEWFRSRPRSPWVPFILQMEPATDRKGNLRFDENQVRQIRRYLKKGQEVCISVSKGEFPGRSKLG